MAAGGAGLVSIVCAAIRAAATAKPLRRTTRVPGRSTGRGGGANGAVQRGYRVTTVESCTSGFASRAALPSARLVGVPLMAEHPWRPLGFLGTLRFVFLSRHGRVGSWRRFGFELVAEMGVKPRSVWIQRVASHG